MSSQALEAANHVSYMYKKPVYTINLFKGETVTLMCLTVSTQTSSTGFSSSSEPALIQTLTFVMDRQYYWRALWCPSFSQRAKFQNVLFRPFSPACQAESTLQCLLANHCSPKVFKRHVNSAALNYHLKEMPQRSSLYQQKVKTQHVVTFRIIVRNNDREIPSYCCRQETQIVCMNYSSTIYYIYYLYSVFILH